MIEPLLRALGGQADTNDVEQLKQVINHVSVPSDLTNLLNNQNGDVLFQPAMYIEKNSSSIKDFVVEVFANPNYYQKAKMGIYGHKLSVPANVVSHDEKHTLTPDDWQEIADNIDNIFVAKKTNKSNSYSTNNYKIGIKTNNGNYYGLIIGINKKDNYICTVLKNTKNGVEAFVDERGKKDKKKNPAMMPSSHPTAPVEQMLNSDVSHSQGSDSIIAYIKEQLNPSEQTKILYQPGYHGSAAKFDKFDDDFIGSGEGAQVHGYGHYVAKDKNIADERYRKILAQPFKNAKYDGIPLHKTNFPKLHHAVLEELFLKGKNEALDKLEDLKKQSNKNKDKDGFLGKSSRKFLEEYNEQLELLNSVDESKITGVNNGQLYQVEIPDDDVLLDEDLPFSEQPKNVQDAIKKIYQDRWNLDIEDSENYNNDFRKAYNELTGGQIYRDIDNVPRFASEILNEYGIKGIKYNGNVDGECFVVFDPKNIEITRTFYQADFNADKQVFDKQKYLIDEKVYDNLIKIHKDLNKIEKSPEYWNGKTVEDAEKYLGFKDDKGVKIQSPIEQISIYKSHLEHLINDNNAYRKKYLNRTISTIKSPNIILKNGDYNNYIKLFYDEKNNVKPHLQIVKVKSDGSFYVTNFKPTKQQIKSSILEGHIIYDVSSVSDIKNTDTSSITDNSSNNNPKRIGYVFKQPDDLQPNLFVNNASERLDSLDTNNEDNLYVEPRGPKGYRGRAVLDKNLIQM